LEACHPPYPAGSRPGNQCARRATGGLAER
jgi:hypothetical protein